MLTKRAIVDALIAAATIGQFRGDKCDGKAPPITIENFLTESNRHGAMALRARLSRLSRGDLLHELVRSAEYLRTRDDETQRQIAHFLPEIERKEAERALSRRQAELGRRRGGLQPAILAAARHYRATRVSNKMAWRAIARRTYEHENGETVVVKGGDEGTMCVLLNGKPKGRPIKIGAWERRYWHEANRPDGTG